MLPVLQQSPCGHPEEPVGEPLNEAGVIYSWTKYHLGEDGPTLLAMADFLDGRVRVTAPVLDVAGIEIGDRVEVVVGRSTPYALRLVSS